MYNRNNEVIKSLKVNKKNRKVRKRKKISIGIIMSLMLILIFGTIAFAQSPGKSDVSKLDRFEQVKVCVYSDRLPWNIQKELTPHENINEMLYLVSEINQNDLSNVKSGEQLIFLKEKEN